MSRKRVLSCLLCIVMVLGMLPVQAFAADIVASGYCGGEGDGTNLAWTLDSNGVLTINGSGAMTDYRNYWNQNLAPWGEYSASINTLILDDGITHIGDNAFHILKTLSGDLVIPSSVISIGANAFRECSFTNSLVIPDNVESIGSRAFCDCSNFDGMLTLGSSIKKIENAAFSNTNFSKLSIGLCTSSDVHKTLLEIIATVKEVSVSPDNPNYLLESDILYNAAKTDIIFCSRNKSGPLEIPDGVERILSSAFRGCENLTGDISLPETVKLVDTAAFSGCVGFDGHIYLPRNVILGSDAFSYCSGLTGQLTIPAGITLASGAFQYCTGLTGSIIIPDGVTTIPSSLFYGCTGFDGEIQFGSDVTRIEQFAFKLCKNLTGSLEIPKSVGHIGTCAFEYCNSLNGIAILPPDFSTYGFAFNCGIKEYYFCGNAPTGVSLNYSFPKDAILYYLDGTSGWTDNNAYNAEAGTWNGYKLEVWDNSGGGDNPVDFNEYIYRANTALDSENEHYSRWQEYLHGKVGDGTPSHVTVDACKETGFAALANTWTKTTKVFDSLVSSPTVGVKYLTVTQEDMYTAIILDSLECSYKIDIVSKAKNDTKKTRDWLSLVCSYFNSLVDYETVTEQNLNEIYGKLSESEKESIADWVAAEFSSEYGTVDDIKGLSDFLQYLSFEFDAFDTFESWIENAKAYWRVLQLSDEMHKVIQQMYNSCPDSNTAMKKALKNCDNVIRAGEEDFAQLMMKDGFKAVGEFGVLQACDMLWGSITTVVEGGFPIVILVKVIYKAGKLLANELFNADAQAEAYYKLLAMLNFEHLGQDVMDMYARVFEGGQLEGQARTYLEAVNLNFQIQNTDADYAIKFYQEMKKQPSHIIAEWISGADVDEIIQGWEAHKSLINLSQMRFDTWWIVWLLEDYPELYEKYQHRLYEELKLEKQITVACPVNVYVYDENDKLVAYVKGGKPFASGKISIVVDGDNKNIYFYDSSEYTVKCEGYDSGTMDITIKELNEGVASRSVNYLDIQVSNASTHNLICSEGDYTLDDGDGNTLLPTFDSQGEQETYTVTIYNGFATTNDTFESSFTAHEGEIIDISAYVPNGVTFDGWSSDKPSVSFEDADVASTYFVMINDDVTINALMRSSKSSVRSITLDENYGDASTTDIVTNVDGTLDALPTPTRIGYTFKGWYTAPVGGELVTTDTVFTADTIVYAHWTKNVDYPSIPSVPTNSTKPGNDPDTSDAQNHFTDVPDNAYYSDAVAWTVENGITNGTGDGTTFSPNASCTRGQAVTFLWRAAGCPAPKSSVMPFTDVKAGSYCYEAVLWAVEQGITKGTGDGTTFSPNATCTRAQIVTFLWRAQKSPTAAGANSFTDVAADSYCSAAVQWAVENGITEGTGDGTTFSPNAICTRAQIVTFLYRSYQK